MTKKLKLITKEDCSTFKSTRVYLTWRTHCIQLNRKNGYRSPVWTLKDLKAVSKLTNTLAILNLDQKLEDGIKGK